MEVGKKIKELREEKGITQRELAKKINVMDKTISKWENGILEPNMESLKKLADYFNVSIECFYGEEKSIKKKKYNALDGLLLGVPMAVGLLAIVMVSLNKFNMNALLILFGISLCSIIIYLLKRG